MKQFCSKILTWLRQQLYHTLKWCHSADLPHPNRVSKKVWRSVWRWFIFNQLHSYLVYIRVEPNAIQWKNNSSGGMRPIRIETSWDTFNRKSNKYFFLEEALKQGMIRNENNWKQIKVLCNLEMAILTTQSTSCSIQRRLILNEQ